MVAAKRLFKEESYKNKSKQRAAKNFIAEGAVNEASNNLGSSFITPFALAIGANSAHIGFLSAFTELFSPLGQMLGSRLMEKQSRKTILLRFVLLQALLWLPIIALTFFFWKQIGTPYLPYALIFFYAAWAFVVGVKNPSFFSWIGDVVPEERRGAYFAQRNRILGIVGIVVFLTASFVLDFFKTKGYVLVGFTILFSLSFLLRFVSRGFFRRSYSPSFHLRKKNYFSLWAFIRRYDNFGKFAFYQACFNFTIMIASPFFAVYMLQDLNFNYFTFTLVSLSSTLFYILFTPMMGRISDRYGNVRLLYLAGILFPLTPFLWIFLKDPVALFFLPGLTAGLGNAAFSLGVTNFMYDSVSPEKRGICVAYTSVLNGIGIFLGSILGGLMIQYLPITFMSKTLFVFALAAVARLLVGLLFLPYIKEVRKVKRLQGISVNVSHPFRMVHTDVVWFKQFFRK